MRIKRTVGSRRWTSSVAAFAPFAAFGVLCATLAYWSLQLLAPPVAIAPTGSLVDYRNVPDLVSATALFGRMPSSPASAEAVAADVRVLGVAASPTRGSAVLVIDSGGAKAYMVGDRVGEDMRLLEVRSDAAVLERNGARIELRAPQRPSVALLSSGPSAASASPASASSPARLGSSAGGTTAGDPPGAAPIDPTQNPVDADPMQRFRAGSGRAAGAPLAGADSDTPEWAAQAAEQPDGSGEADGASDTPSNEADRR